MPRWPRTPWRESMSQYNAVQHSERSDNITISQCDDDDFSDMWEQGVVEENKGWPRSTRAMGYSDGESFTSRNTGASSLGKNEADLKNRIQRTRERKQRVFLSRARNLRERIQMHPPTRKTASFDKYSSLDSPAHTRPDICRTTSESLPMPLRSLPY